jgi:hypothetical protein
VIHDMIPVVHHLKWTIEQIMGVKGQVETRQARGSLGCGVSCLPSFLFLHVWYFWPGEWIWMGSKHDGLLGLLLPYQLYPYRVMVHCFLSRNAYE